MISSNNPLQGIAFSLADITVLKANEVEGVVVLRVALSETQQGMHGSLSGRKAVVLKWTRQTSMELAVHKLLTGKPEFVTLLHGQEGIFSLRTIFPCMDVNAVDQLRKAINVTEKVLNKERTFSGSAKQCFMVMEAMDDSLEGKLPYFSLEARECLEKPVSRILHKAIKTLQGEQLCHGDFYPRNIFIKEVKTGVYRVKCGDFGAACPITNSKNDNIAYILSTIKTATQCRKTKNSNSVAEITGAITVAEGPSPRKRLRPIRMKGP